MKKFFVLLIMFLSCAFAFAGESVGVIYDLLGRFGKLSDGLDKLRYRPADGQSIFGFYLNNKAVDIPIKFAENAEYVILASSDKQINCDILKKPTYHSQHAQSGTRIYLKYKPSSSDNTLVRITQDTPGVTPVILIVMVRDKFCLPLPFDDLIVAAREMNDNRSTRDKILTDKTDFFLIGGDYHSGTSDSKIFPDGFTGDFRVALFGSRTISNVSLAFLRGGSIADKTNDIGSTYMDISLSRQTSYRMLFYNKSPLVFEHGILFLTFFDR